MPVYELKCRECEHQWDVKIPWKAPLPACPECESEDVRKVYHAAAIIFKGNGWHVTDYDSSKPKANGSSSSSSSSDSGSTSSSDSSSSSKTETKSEPAKSESKSDK